MTAPLFFALFVGAIVMGIWAWHQAGLQNGAQAAARCAALGRSDCQSDAAIKTFAKNNTMGIVVDTSDFTVDRTANCGIRVNGQKQFGDFLAFANLKAVTLTASACFPLPTTNPSSPSFGSS